MNPLANYVREFIRLLEIEEESDSGRIFRPNTICSTRALDGQKMQELLEKMKDLVR